MASKSKFFRVCVSGPTVDGREIKPEWLNQMAANYNRDTYAARGNLEHIRGVTGQAPFNAVADILALKADDVTIDIAGKPEKRTALFAQIEATADLVALNKAKQKLYSSVEINTDFANSKQAYLMGLAFTDSPASIGTERLEFSQRAKVYGNEITDPNEANIELEPDGDTEMKGLFSSIKAFVDGLSSNPTNLAKSEPIVTAPVLAAPADPTKSDLQAFAGVFGQALTQMAETLSTATKASQTQIDQISTKLTALESTINKTPAHDYTARPNSSGGDGVIMAEC